MRNFMCLLAAALLALGVPGCNVFNDFGNAECKLNNNVGCGNSGTGGAGGSPTLVCQGGTTLYICNIDNTAFQTPSSPFDPFPTSTCGLGFCGNSSDMAKNQAAAFTGVDPSNPWLVCLNTGTTTETGFHALFQAIAQIPGVDLNDFDSLCVAAPGTTTCGNPCDDGQGGTLQGPGLHCGGLSTCCQGLTCVGASASLMGTCQGTLTKCAPQAPPQHNWQGLDTPTLRTIAIANKIDGCDTQTGIAQHA
jgi:hypothetical protein